MIYKRSLVSSLGKFSTFANVAHIKQTSFWQIAFLQCLFEHSRRLSHRFLGKDPSSPVYSHCPLALSIFKYVDAIVRVSMHWRHYDLYQHVNNNTAHKGRTYISGFIGANWNQSQIPWSTQISYILEDWAVRVVIFWSVIIDIFR